MSHVLYFTADWCSPCQKTRPIAEELKLDGFIDFIFVDVDFEPELVENFEIKSVPTFILIKDGKEIYRTTGSKTKEQLKEIMNYE